MFTITIDDKEEMTHRDRYVCSWSSTYSAARQFANMLKLEIQSPIKTRQSDVLNVTLEDTKPARANDILNTQLADQKHSIEISIANLVKIYIEPLYLLLQQKREEAQIQMYSQMDNFRVIEQANGNNSSISPKSMQIYLLSIILGCCIPLVVVWARMQLRTTVETKKDVTDHITEASVLAVLPRAPEDGNALIGSNSRDAVSEAFRNLRTNLQYLTSVKVIQVISSIPGEGKTFVASNLAVSIAHMGKKVLLIGMDIRKPRLSEIFSGTNVDRNNTVVGFLIGKCDNPDKLVNHTEASPHLDVVFAGPVPPNPTELLSQGAEGEIIRHFREKYDYIIIDSAPFMPVSDSFIINEYVDATLYTIRANRMPLAMLNDINECIHSTTKPIKRVSLVLNDLDSASSKYRYGYGNGYGYGYGYGQDDENSENGHAAMKKLRGVPDFLLKKNQSKKVTIPNNSDHV